jgi:hypothetical protein
MKFLKLDNYFDFGFQTQNFATGVASDADSLPTYRVYEEGQDTPIATGNCSVKDDSNTVGYYKARAQVTSAGGYTVGKIYEVRIEATVATVSGACVVGRFGIFPANIYDAFFVGTAPELTGDPGTTPDAAQILMLLYMWLRNDSADTPTLRTVKNNAGTTVLSATVSDTGSTFSQGKLG